MTIKITFEQNPKQCVVCPERVGSEVGDRGPSDRWQCVCGGVPPAPDCSGRPVCVWPPWPLPHSVPEPEPWPCQSLTQQASINTKPYYRTWLLWHTHTHTHIPHISGFATLHSRNKVFENSIFSLCWNDNTHCLLNSRYFIRVLIHRFITSFPRSDSSSKRCQFQTVFYFFFSERLLV